MNDRALSRRGFLKFATAVPAVAPLFKWRDALAATGSRVVVVGGGFAGATAAKYLKLWGGTSVDVTLVEPKQEYYTPILSNEALVGELPLTSLRFTYAALQTRYGVRHLPVEMTALDAQARQLTLSDGSTLAYDRLILAPGIEFKYANRYDTRKVPVAWQGGPEVIRLQRMLSAMPSGGTFVMTVPRAPYRCPPGPYERACVVADWLQRNKPGSKVIVLDANDGNYILWSGIFQDIFAGFGNLQRIGNAEVTAVDDAAPSVTVSINGQNATYAADVLNVIPNMRSGAYDILQTAGIIPGGEDWAPVDGQTFESLQKSGIHVIGDAQFMNEVPKAGHVANAEAKVCANAVLRALSGVSPYASPQLTSACYSPVTRDTAIWISERFHYQSAVRHQDDFTLVDLSVNSPPTRSNKQAMYDWTKNLFSDTFL